ncbi:hypothetical protein QZH41_003497 [Actinostola sp. cb2023]|nr:hypothetical protein QZH41_003497 [Actinostola sp. cb2023]
MAEQEQQPAPVVVLPNEAVPQPPQEAVDAVENIPNVEAANNNQNDPPAKRQKLDFVQLAQQPVKTSEVKWCNSQGEPIDTVGPGPDPTVVSQAKVLASPRATFFRDPAHFIPGELHRQADRWKFIPIADPEIISLVLNKVDAWNFIVHFKGRFGNQAYDAPYPPHKIFPNNQSCLEFEEFITNTILERLVNSSLSFWGLVGDVEPPHLVMPITVEPTKPRMCHDERFLNLWIKDLPFTLDYLSDIPRYVEANHFQTVCDDKSGYDHVSLTRNCQTLFGLSWKGCYFCYRTLPFGWKASAYIYHSIGLIATSHIRSLGVPCSQYIDDRHIGQLITSPACQWSNYEKAEAACYIATTTLTSLGYTLALSKSSLAPNQVVKFLGYLCDSRRCAFILPEVKKEKFRALREKILSHEEIDVKSLQRFAGKTTSFSIAVPAARLYTRTCYRAIGISSKTPTWPVKVVGELRKEILHWRFLDAWKGHLPWFEERHRVVRSFTDASNSGWGAKLSLEPGSSQYLRDYWCDEDRAKPIVIREALALRNALAAMGESLQHSRVDGHVDSLPLVQSWKNQGGKSKDLTAVIRSIYEIALRFNIALSLWSAEFTVANLTSFCPEIHLQVDDLAVDSSSAPSCMRTRNLNKYVYYTASWEDALHSFKNGQYVKMLDFFMCLKNIQSFLTACTQYFNISEEDLFDAIELYDVSDFAKVVHTLSKLSHTPKAVRRGVEPFAPNSPVNTSTYEDEDIYSNLEEIALSRDITEEENPYDVVNIEEDDKIYEDLLSVQYLPVCPVVSINLIKALRI